MNRRSFASLLALAAVVPGCAASPDTRDEVDPTSPATAETEAELRRRACRATTRDAEGPYYRQGAPWRAQIADITEAGDRLVVEGQVMSLASSCRTARGGHVVDVWQADAGGAYYTNGRLRGRIVTDDTGRFVLETIVPGRYAENGQYRPAHLHVKVFAPDGRELLTTQLYFAGDPFLAENDYCTRDGTCNSSDPARAMRLSAMTLRGGTAKKGHVDLIV